MASRGPRLVSQRQTRFLRGTAALLGVAATAARHDVLPGVGAALSLWNNVVDVLGSAVAVLAAV